MGTSRKNKKHISSADVRYKEGVYTLARYGGENAWGAWLGTGPHDSGSQQAAGPFNTLRDARAWCRDNPYSMKKCWQTLGFTAEGAVLAEQILPTLIQAVHLMNRAEFQARVAGGGDSDARYFAERVMAEAKFRVQELPTRSRKYQKQYRLENGMEEP